MKAEQYEEENNNEDGLHVGGDGRVMAGGTLCAFPLANCFMAFFGQWYYRATKPWSGSTTLLWQHRG